MFHACLNLSGPFTFSGYVRSEDTAVDYSNIDELAEENEKFVRIGLEVAQGSSKDVDGNLSSLPFVKNVL